MKTYTDRGEYLSGDVFRAFLLEARDRAYSIDENNKQKRALYKAFKIGKKFFPHAMDSVPKSDIKFKSEITALVYKHRRDGFIGRDGDVNDYILEHAKSVPHDCGSFLATIYASELGLGRKIPRGKIIKEGKNVIILG